MEKLVENFQECFQRGLIIMKNNLFDKIIKNFSFLYFSHEKNMQFDDLNFQSKKTNFIVIDKYTKEQKNITENFNIICIDQKVIIIKENELKHFFQLFPKQIIKIHCFLNEIHQKIKNLIKQNSFKCDFFIDDHIQTLQEEIDSFQDAFLICKTNDEKINLIWEIVHKCISGYLIRKSYVESNFDRIELISELFESNQEKIKFNCNNSIKLRYLTMGTISQLFLLYHIEKEKLFVIKIFVPKKESDFDLFERERQNYEKIHHPFICRCFGSKGNEIYDNLVIEYIDGNELTNINNLHLLYEDKIKIIFQIMLILDYLHHKNFIYRDLKPNNLILTKDKIPILIDFDRMIENTNNDLDKEFTNDFSHYYVAPEVLTQSFSYQADIYSLGKIIYFIFKKNLQSKQLLPEFQKINKIINDCTQENPNLRPKLTELIDHFYIDFLSNFSNKIFETKTVQSQKNIHDAKFFQYWICLSEYTNCNSHFLLGKSYDDNGVFPVNINKAIHYYLLASEQNEPKSLCNLSFIYYSNIHIPQNINKAIYYSFLGTKLNFAPSFFNLGIYYQYIPSIQDIGKSIYYYKKAADLNEQRAFFQLGVIYSNKKYGFFDIEKAIHYYSLLADNQKDVNAQFNLGCLYVERNINEAIRYFSLASEKNLPSAQCKLGFIYLTENSVKDIDKAVTHLLKAADFQYPEALFILGQVYSKRQYGLYDINKALYYFELASKYNYVKAQSFCGNYYFSHLDLPKALNKTIHYYTLAAENGSYVAQVNLASIYYNGDLIPRDMTKAIHFYTLAADNNDNENAQYMLGMIYLEGIGIKRDIKKGVYYLERSAEKKYVRAQYAIGKIFYKGIYVIRDVYKSIHYFKLAAIQNHLEALTNLGIIYFEMKDLEKSIFYLELAAEKNEPHALYIIGGFSLNGEYVKKDITKGINYLTRSASFNYPRALFLLGDLYFNGKIVPKDVDKGIRYLSIAAVHNNGDAFYFLGKIYILGIECRQNISKAIYYLTFGSELNHTLCNFFLGTIYFSNACVHSNIEKSIYYYKKGSSLNCAYSKNNLGIIYKNGIDVPINIYFAIELFNEAIRIKKLNVSMYNLASIYLFNDDPQINDINKSISLLIILFTNKFPPAQFLLYLALIKKYKNITLTDVQKEFKNNLNLNLAKKILTDIDHFNLKDPKQYKREYEKYKTRDYVCLYNFAAKLTSIFRSFNKYDKMKIDIEKFNITKEFYEGFGIC